MNIFRIVADFSHLLAMLVLVFRILNIKSCAGLSGKSQVFYFLVFITRYLDIFSYFVSYYNLSLKILFLVLTAFTIYLIYCKFQKSYDKANEMPYAEVLIFVCLSLALLFHHDFTFMEITWTFSIYLESVAILPQLFMIRKTKKADSITVYYLLLLGMYRALYIVNWIWRYYFEGFYDVISLAGGVVQTVLYCDFFYIFCSKSSSDYWNENVEGEEIANI